MAVLAPVDWLWERHPDVGMSNLCADGACERCRGTFIDFDTGERHDCGCPHPHAKQDKDGA